MALSLQQIIGTITGKLAFERTQANFQEIQTAVNTNETNIAGKLGTSHNVDAAAHNDIRESINTLASQSCKVYSSTSQSIPDGVATALNFNTEYFDTDNIHDVVTNNTRLTCNKAGKYLIIGQMRFNANATNIRSAQIRLNGASVIANVGKQATQTGSIGLDVSTLYNLNVGDYVELLAYQNSGGAISLTVSADSPVFQMVKVG